MNITHKRKSTTAISLSKSLKKITPEDLWVYNSSKLSMDEYHQVKAMSASTLKDFANPNLSDYYLWRKHIKRDLVKSSSANFVVGSAFHTAVLESYLFNDEYTVQPKFDKRTKQGKIDFAEWETANSSKQALTQEQFDLVSLMAKKVKRNKQASLVMKGCSVETSAFTRVENGEVLKGRADLVNLNDRYAVDLKSVEDCSPAGFAKASANFRYDLQAHIYMKLFGLDEFIFLCCSKSDPLEVNLYTLNEEFMGKAAQDYEFAVERYARVKKMVAPESFTSIDNPMIILAPPAWFKFQ